MMLKDALHALVGGWRSTGRTIAQPGEPAIAIAGTDRYEWLAGEHFLVHHVDVAVGDEQVNVLEVIGPCVDGRPAPMNAFDNHGEHSVMQLTATGARALRFDGARMRATLAIEAETMAATWERRGDDGAWRPWMEMRFERAR